jgi:predicted enzyme related to lactoylglutathione lyase
VSEKRPKVGSILWRDLTVPNADEVRDFYAAVVGWKPEPVEMGGYSDYNMVSPETGAPEAGVCHARGGNAGLPPQWLLYVTVEDLDTSLVACEAMGGEVVAPPRSMGGARTCVIRDPAGAVCALYQPAPEAVAAKKGVGRARKPARRAARKPARAKKPSRGKRQRRAR